MKGLLIKDIKLVSKQKSLIVLWLVMALFLLIANHDPVFGVSYGMFLMGIMLVGTISYDDYDNGMGFLMTLPVNRKTYVIEKYVLILGGVFLAGVFVTACGVIYLICCPGELMIGEFLVTATVIFFIVALFSAVMLPVQLKYGAEKGRIILVVFAGIVVVASFLIRRAEQFLQPVFGQFTTVFIMLSDVDPGWILLGLAFVTIPLVLLSIAISVRILKNEEY